ncbi:unnamed protein product [Calicophoron daubneyi]|uniref:Uncharacterized protein n=1 Tax=Calicophoron daubneyi TaxID=300641 RepID=A0AAV2TDI8_CALDB
MEKDYDLTGGVSESEHRYASCSKVAPPPPQYPSEGIHTETHIRLPSIGRSPQADAQLTCPISLAPQGSSRCSGSPHVSSTSRLVGPIMGTSVSTTQQQVHYRSRIARAECPGGERSDARGLPLNHPTPTSTQHHQQSSIRTTPKNNVPVSGNLYSLQNTDPKCTPLLSRLLAPGFTSSSTSSENIAGTSNGSGNKSTKIRKSDESTNLPPGEKKKIRMDTRNADYQAAVISRRCKPNAAKIALSNESMNSDTNNGQNSFGNTVVTHSRPVEKCHPFIGHPRMILPPFDTRSGQGEKEENRQHNQQVQARIKKAEGEEEEEAAVEGDDEEDDEDDEAERRTAACAAEQEANSCSTSGESTIQSNFGSAGMFPHENDPEVDRKRRSEVDSEECAVQDLTLHDNVSGSPADDQEPVPFNPPRVRDLKTRVCLSEESSQFEGLFHCASHIYVNEAQSLAVIQATANEGRSGMTNYGVQSDDEEREVEQEDGERQLGGGEIHHSKRNRSIVSKDSMNSEMDNFAHDGLHIKMDRDQRKSYLHPKQPSLIRAICTRSQSNLLRDYVNLPDRPLVHWFTASSQPARHELLVQEVETPPVYGGDGACKYSLREQHPVTNFQSGLMTLPRPPPPPPPYKPLPSPYLHGRPRFSGTQFLYHNPDTRCPIPNNSVLCHIANDPFYYPPFPSASFTVISTEAPYQAQPNVFYFESPSWGPQQRFPLPNSSDSNVPEFFDDQLPTVQQPRGGSKIAQPPPPPPPSADFDPQVQLCYAGYAGRPPPLIGIPSAGAAGFVITSALPFGADNQSPKLTTVSSWTMHCCAPTGPTIVCERAGIDDTDGTSKLGVHSTVAPRAISDSSTTSTQNPNEIDITALLKENQQLRCLLSEASMRLQYVDVLECHLQRLSLLVESMLASHHRQCELDHQLRSYANHEPLPVDPYSLMTVGAPVANVPTVELVRAAPPASGTVPYLPTCIAVPYIRPFPAGIPRFQLDKHPAIGLSPSQVHRNIKARLWEGSSQMENTNDLPRRTSRRAAGPRTVSLDRADATGRPCPSVTIAADLRVSFANKTSSKSGPKAARATDGTANAYQDRQQYPVPNPLPFRSVQMTRRRLGNKASLDTSNIPSSTSPGPRNRLPYQRPDAPSSKELDMHSTQLMQSDMPPGRLPQPTAPSVRTSRPMGISLINHSIQPGDDEAVKQLTPDLESLPYNTCVTNSYQIATSACRVCLADSGVHSDDFLPSSGPAPPLSRKRGQDKTDACLHLDHTSSDYQTGLVNSSSNNRISPPDHRCQQRIPSSSVSPTIHSSSPCQPPENPETRFVQSHSNDTFPVDEHAASSYAISQADRPNECDVAVKSGTGNFEPVRSATPPTDSSLSMGTVIVMVTEADGSGSYEGISPSHSVNLRQMKAPCLSVTPNVTNESQPRSTCSGSCSMSTATAPLYESEQMKSPLNPLVYFPIPISGSGIPSAHSYHPRPGIRSAYQTAYRSPPVRTTQAHARLFQHPSPVLRGNFRPMDFTRRGTSPHPTVRFERPSGSVCAPRDDLFKEPRSPEPWPAVARGSQSYESAPFDSNLRLLDSFSPSGHFQGSARAHHRGGVAYFSPPFASAGPHHPNTDLGQPAPLNPKPALQVHFDTPTSPASHLMRATTSTVPNRNLTIDSIVSPHLLRKQYCFN